MKSLLTLFSVCVLICTNASAQELHRNFERGFSDQYKAVNTLGQYAFGYNEDHTSGGSFRRETGDQFGNKVGSYGLRIADGRIRIVNYVADHNGYRADVMTNEPGVSNQNSNGYFEITKKGFRGVLIPGFRNSAEAPHVSFSKGTADDSHENFSHDSIKQAGSTFNKNVDESHTNVNNGKISERRTTFPKSIDEAHINVNHGTTKDSSSTFSKSIDETRGNINPSNINEPHSTFSKNIDEAQTSFNHGNANEEHHTFKQRNINEPHDSYNYDNTNTEQTTFRKDPNDASRTMFTQSNIDEPVVAIPSENGLDETTWESLNQEPTSMVNPSRAVTDVKGAMTNHALDNSKDLKQSGNIQSNSQRQNYAAEHPEYLTESQATE